MSEFGDRLRTIRKAKGLTMEDMASDLGITRQGYARYESGQGSPTVDSLFQIAATLGVSPKLFFGAEAHFVSYVNEQGVREEYPLREFEEKGILDNLIKRELEKLSVEGLYRVLYYVEELTKGKLYPKHP